MIGLLTGKVDLFFYSFDWNEWKNMKSTFKIKIQYSIEHNFFQTSDKYVRENKIFSSNFSTNRIDKLTLLWIKFGISKHFPASKIKHSKHATDFFLPSPEVK